MTILPKVEIIDGKFYVDGKDVTQKVIEEMTHRVEEIEVVNTGTQIRMTISNITIPIGTIKDLKDNQHG